VALLGQTINQVRRGEVEPKVANAIGYLSSAVLSALEVGDLEERLADLETIVKHQERPESPFDINPAGEVAGPAEGTAT